MSWTWFWDRDNDYWQEKLDRAQEEYDTAQEEYNMYSEQYDRVVEAYNALKIDYEEMSNKEQWAQDLIEQYNTGTDGMRWVGSNFNVFKSEVENNVVPCYEKYTSALRDILNKLLNKQNVLSEKKTTACQRMQSAAWDIADYRDKIK
ncbi:MAG: hypothetical protein ACI4DS_07750 [Eubacterium sp.]